MPLNLTAAFKFGSANLAEYCFGFMAMVLTQFGLPALIDKILMTIVWVNARRTGNSSGHDLFFTPGVAAKVRRRLQHPFEFASAFMGFLRGIQLSGQAEKTVL